MMLGITLLSLSLTALAGVHAAPLGLSAARWSPRDFRQGTEPLGRGPADPDTDRRADPVEVPVQRSGAGWVRVEEHPEDKVPEGFRQGTEPIMPIPEGFRQGTEPIMPIPEGFRQGTEPIMAIPEGFRQGTERIMPIPEGFRQGTERIMAIPEGFRQGTERIMAIPEGFRQGTERIMPIPEGFRQGTERIMPIPEGFRQGTEPIMPIPKGFRQGTEPLTYGLATQKPACKGKVIKGRCYQYNPKPLSFHDAQSACRGLAPRAGLASVADEGAHSSLVSMVTKDGAASPVLTWLGGVVKDRRAQWVDGSAWGYSAWMRGQPDLAGAKPACLVMFDERWWSMADCELLRASICCYPLAA